MMTATGTTTVGTITEATGAATSGAGNKPAAKPSAGETGNADATGNGAATGSTAMSGPCTTATKPITTTIAADSGWNQSLMGLSCSLVPSTTP